MKQKKEIIITSRIDKDLDEWINKVAASMKKGKSTTIRIILEKYRAFITTTKL